MKLIGTHHFMKEEEIRKIIEDEKPDIVLVELCNGRISMINHPQIVKEKFSILGWIAKSLRKKAKQENQVYGSDMISAYKIAKEKNIRVGLIDRPMVETSVLFKAIPLKEKLYMIKQLIKFNSKKINVSDILSELNDEGISDIVNQFKKDCPNLHYYLISSRDEYMINKIKAILYDNPEKKIIAFVGKGHIKFLEGKLNG